VAVVPDQVVRNLHNDGVVFTPLFLQRRWSPALSSVDVERDVNAWGLRFPISAQAQ
jgi:hypothetical protein